MLRLYTDFNARTTDGDCWILVHKGADLDPRAVSDGERVILYQDDDDFEVEATVGFRFIDAARRTGWVATPDWSTKRSIPSAAEERPAAE